MSQGIPLNKLCHICNNATPKYRCPGCGNKTCSLPCYKRHQKLAQCNGQRNPAAYVKPNDLATPSGVDRDYNFLYKVERVFDKARSNAEDHGVSINSCPTYQNDKSVQLRKAVQNSQIIRHRAPKGMTRSKENNTRYHPSFKCISWTVEWFLPDGSRVLRNTLESEPLDKAHRRLLEERENPALQKSQKRSKKRKRHQHVSEGTTSKTINHVMQNAETNVNVHQNHRTKNDASSARERLDRSDQGPEMYQPALTQHSHARDDSENIEREEDTNINDAYQREVHDVDGDDGPEEQTSKNLLKKSTPPGPSDIPVTQDRHVQEDPKTLIVSQPVDKQSESPQPTPPDETHSTGSTKTASPTRSQSAKENDTSFTSPNVEKRETVSASTEEVSSEIKLNFYLLKPHTSGSTPVLIPLNANATLNENLRFKPILEYPTIYVLSHQSGDEHLPEGFEIEHKYTERIQNVINDLDKEMEPFGGFKGYSEGASEWIWEAPKGAGKMKDGGSLEAHEEKGFDEKELIDRLGKDLNHVMGK